MNIKTCAAVLMLACSGQVRAAGGALETLKAESGGMKAGEAVIQLSTAPVRVDSTITGVSWRRVDFRAANKAATARYGSCELTDQSWTTDSSGCRNSEGKSRCYAEVSFGGASLRLYGSCVTSPSECRGGGAAAVANPCDSIELLSGSLAHAGGSCSVNDQSWTVDSSACGNMVRCYADVDLGGAVVRFYGGCVDNNYAYACHGGNAGAVNPCI